MKARKVYSPLRVFEEAVVGLADFARERKVTMGPLSAEVLEKIGGEQAAEGKKDVVLERAYREGHRAFLKNQEARFVLFQKALEIARALFRDDAAALQSLRRFARQINRPSPRTAEEAPAA